MNARRAAAAVVAVALVVAAFVVRGALDDPTADGPTTTSGPPTTPPPVAASGLVCAAELAEVCEVVQDQHPELGVTVEDAGRTLDRLAALDDPGTAPLWVTIAPFPAMVDALRPTSPVAYEIEPLGASRLAVALPAGGRAAALTAACAGDPLWRCVGDRAGDDWTELGGEAGWRTLRPALGDVDGSALGLLSFAAAVAGYLGSVDFGPNAWDADRSFNPWLRSLARASSEAPNSAGTPLRTMATGRSLDVAATTDGELRALGANGARFELVYPAPEMSLQAVLAVPPGAAAPARLADQLADALTDRGWTATTSDQLPAPATMIALRELWGDAA